MEQKKCFFFATLTMGLYFSSEITTTKKFKIIHLMSIKSAQIKYHPPGEGEEYSLGEKREEAGEVASKVDQPRLFINECNTIKRGELHQAVEGVMTQLPVASHCPVGLQHQNNIQNTLKSYYNIIINVLHYTFSSMPNTSNHDPTIQLTNRTQQTISRVTFILVTFMH